MKRLVFVMLVLGLLCVPVAHAQEPVFAVLGAIHTPTTAVPTTDTSQMFTAAFETAYGATVDWSTVRSALIQSRTNGASLAFGVAASTSLGYQLAVQASFIVPSLNALRQMRIISDTAGSAASLQVTLFK